MSDLLDRIELFQLPILATLAAGLVCPLLGCFLYVRRTGFYGIALPQFAWAGVLAGYVVLPWWHEHIGLGGVDLMTALTDSHAAANYHLAWASTFTFGGLLALVWLGRRGGSEIGRVATGFALASAATIVLGQYSAIGQEAVRLRLEGEVTTIGAHECETLLGAFAFVLLAFVLFHRDFLLVSYDRESARVLRKRVTAFEALLNVVTGLTIAVGTITLGPILLFGVLVVPAHAARAWSWSMTSFLVIASATGFVAGALGFALSLWLDWPLGATVVGASALALVPGLFRPRA